MLKKRFALLFVVFSMVITSGCEQILPERIEITDLNIIRAIGIDKDENTPGNICVTLISKQEKKEENSEESGGTAQKGKAEVMIKSARTILQAERELQSHSDKRVYFGHVKFFLIGEEAAREGITKHIDFLARDHDIRHNSKVYIVEGMTAREFIEKTSTMDYFLPDLLKALGQNSKNFAGANEVMLHEFLYDINKKQSCAIVPTIKISPEKEEEIDLGGYAVFKDLALKFITDLWEVRAINLLKKIPVKNPIELNDPNGYMVALDIYDSKADIKAVKKDGELQAVKVEVVFSTNINEVHNASTLFTEEALDQLTDKQSNIIRSELEAVIKKAKEQNTDFVNFATTIETKQPILWRKYLDKWEEVFPNLPVSIEVRSKIHRSYTIREPSGVVEEELK